MPIEGAATACRDLLLLESSLRTPLTQRQAAQCGNVYARMQLYQPNVRPGDTWANPGGFGGLVGDRSWGFWGVVCGLGAYRGVVLCG